MTVHNCIMKQIYFKMVWKQSLFKDFLYLCCAYSIAPQVSTLVSNLPTVIKHFDDVDTTSVVKKNCTTFIFAKLNIYTIPVIST